MDRCCGTPFRWFLPTFGPNQGKESGTSLGFPSTVSSKPEDFELRSKGKLSIVCFRYVPRELAENEEALDALNKGIMERMQAEGTAFVTNTTLAGRFVLRACILHYGTTERDIDAMLQAVRGIARQVINP